MYIQGGELNRVFFAGPLLSPLRAVSRKIGENRWGRSEEWHKCGCLTRAAVTLEMACRQTTTHSFAWKKNKMKIFKGFSNSQNMVFNVKKLLNIGVDLKLR
jgi:hypothetical protein